MKRATLLKAPSRWFSSSMSHSHNRSHGPYSQGHLAALFLVTSIAAFAAVHTSTHGHIASADAEKSHH